MTSLIPDISFIDNSEQRTPLILVLDCSGSMTGRPIQVVSQSTPGGKAQLPPTDSGSEISV